MKKAIFSGVGTALVTPFAGGKIDYSALEVLIERQIEARVGAIIIGGTTGEAATLEDGERYELFRTAGEMIGGRCRLVLGTGTNDTRVAIKHTIWAEKIGCDGALLVTPYYNKGTDEGLIAHYRAIHDATSLPLILYNVPSRTGVNLSLGAVARLAECERVVGIKEASGSLDRLIRLSALDIPLYAGNDSEVYTVLSLGGCGVISVVSNLYPDLMVSLYEAYRKGRTEAALDIERRLLPLIDALFSETNPTPIKYALWHRGLCLPDMRLPLTVASERTRQLVDEAMKKIEEK